jgi:RNA polymerase sigma-70 factor (ECF subfamily)
LAQKFQTAFVVLREGIIALKRLIRLNIAITEPAQSNEQASQGIDAKNKIQSSFLLKLQRNDQDAWEKVINEYSPKLFSYLRYNLPTREDAEDILNETFMAAVKSIRNFDGKSALTTWLYTLAHHKTVDFWRKHQHTTELLPSLSVSQNESGLDFQEALNRLPELARQVLLLRYREDLSVGEIAKVLGRSYKATESLLSRSRDALRDALSDAGIYNAEELDA